MPSDYLLKLILEIVGMPAEISAGILALSRQGLLNLILSAVSICISMIAISIKKSFLQQAGISLLREPVAVLAGGIMWYGVGIALILVFLISIVGFPVAVLILFVMIYFIFIGQASLSIMFGDLLADKLNRALGTYQSALIGALIIEGVKYLPYIQWAFQFLIIPVLAMGMLSTAFVNGYIKKVFYPVPPEKQKQTLGQDRLRGIILNEKAIDGIDK